MSPKEIKSTKTEIWKVETILDNIYKHRQLDRWSSMQLKVVQRLNE